MPTVSGPDPYARQVPIGDGGAHPGEPKGFAAAGAEEEDRACPGAGGGCSDSPAQATAPSAMAIAAAALMRCLK
jgi:hypothetical protein